MDSLPFHHLQRILLKLDPKSLATMQCINRSFKLLISGHNDFMSKYLSQVRSNSFHISTFGSNLLLRYKKPLKRVSQIDQGGSCSLLHQLFLSGLYVDNNRFRILFHSELMLLPESSTESKPEWVKTYRTALEELDGRTTRRNIIGLMEFIKGSTPEETMYRFEINAELAETTLTCRSSNLNTERPVIIDGALCWLRNDGSIVAFNHETKQAKLITISFPRELSSKMMIATTADNKLGLILARDDVICVYALNNIFEDPIWVLVRRIVNGVVLDEEKVVIELDVMIRDDKLISPLSMIIRLLDHYEKTPCACAPQNLLQRKETQLGIIRRAPQPKRMRAVFID